MANKSAVFIDIDGTLTGGRYIVPPENVRWLKKARQAGHKIFINTGRSWGNIPQDLRNIISFADGIICGNGSHLIFDGRDVFKKFIPVSTLVKLIDYIKSHHELWCVFEGEKDLFYIEDFAHTRKDNAGKTEIESSEKYASEYSGCGIEVVAIGKTPPEDFEKEFDGELTVFRLDTYSDCVAYGCSKADGMRKAVEWAGVSPENTIAIGDSENDRSMLENAGTAVAMGNAPDEIKEIADFVTLTNNEAGVAYAIRHLLFAEEENAEKN